MRRVLALAVACASLFALFSIAPAAASGRGVTFNIQLGIIPCLSGTGPASQTMVVSVKTPSGDLRMRSHVDVDSQGDWFTCIGFFDAQVHGGDRVIAKVGTLRREWVLPPLSIRADRSNGTLSGRTVPNAHVTVLVLAPEGGNGVNRTVVANANGVYHLYVGARNLIGGNIALASLDVGEDSVTAFAIAPAMLVRRGSDVVEGVTAGYQPVHVELLARDGRVRASVVVQAINGISWTAALRDANGRPAYPEVGETVRASGGREGRVLVPAATIHGNTATDVVSGTCMPKARYIVDIGHQGERGYRIFAYRGTTDSSGHLAQSVRDRFDLASGDDLLLACYFASGDIYALSNIVR